MEKKRIVSRTFAGAALVLLGGGCDPSAPTPAGDSAAPASADPATASANVTASASASAPHHPQMGRWVAEFEATRGDVSVPPGVPYAWWDRDDGSAAMGKGKVLLEISRQGAVTGNLEGALGQLVLRGAIEDGTLRAGLFPKGEELPKADDPATEGGEGMSGVLVGTLAGDAIEGELRVSSHDAALVRHADVHLSQVR